MIARLMVAVCASMSVAVLTAQGPQPTSSSSSIRTAANYVRLDLYATRDRLPIDDLSAEDVEVLEDGVRQTLEQFEQVRIPTEQASPVDSATGTARTRVFVLFLDTYHSEIDASREKRLALVRFLDRTVAAGDVIAVMTPDMLTADLEWTAKATLLSNIMQDDWEWARNGRRSRTHPKDDLYATCYPEGQDGRAAIGTEMQERRREKATFDALQALIVRLGGEREERKAIVTVSDGWRVVRENRDLATDRRTSSRDDDLRKIFGRRPREPRQSDPVSGATRTECETDRRQLAGLDHTNRLQQIAEDANRANATFYAIAAASLEDANSGASSQRSAARASASNANVHADSLRFLGDNTDGTVVLRSSALESASARIVADVSSYYLLGYSSTNTRLDGRFRNITVRVKRSGAQVRTRRGYRGASPDDVLGTRTSSVTAGSDPILDFDARRSPFRIRTASWLSPDEEAGATMWIVGELDYSVRQQLEWTAGATAELVVVAGDGVEITKQTLPFDAGEGSFSARIPDAGGLRSGEYAVRVRVSSAADPGASLSDTARAEVPERPTPFGEALLWRRGPSTGPRYMMTADARFQRTERLRLELPTRAAGTVTARLLDTVGKPLPIPVQVSERRESSTDLRWLVVDATLAPLAAGRYAVEVTLGSAAGVTPFRIIP